MLNNQSLNSINKSLEDYYNECKIAKQNEDYYNKWLSLTNDLIKKKINGLKKKIDTKKKAKSLNQDKLIKLIDVFELILKKISEIKEKISETLSFLLINKSQMQSFEKFVDSIIFNNEKATDILKKCDLIFKDFDFDNCNFNIDNFNIYSTQDKVKRALEKLKDTNNKIFKINQNNEIKSEYKINNSSFLNHFDRSYQTKPLITDLEAPELKKKKIDTNINSILLNYRKINTNIMSKLELSTLFFIFYFNDVL